MRFSWCSFPAILFDQNAVADQPAGNCHSRGEWHASRPRLSNLHECEAWRQSLQERSQLAAAEEDQGAGQTRMMQGVRDTDEISPQARCLYKFEIARQRKRCRRRCTWVHRRSRYEI